MLSHYLKIAFRNLRRQKLYAFVNVFGLAVGLAFCILIFLYVRDEHTFDRFHEQKDSIYRVYRATYEPDGSLEQNDPWLPIPLGPALKSDLPEVENFVRLSPRSVFIQSGGAAVEDDVLFADPSFFEVFTFPLAAGDQRSSLTAPRSAVLTTTAAEKYFGDEDPIGRELLIRFDDEFVPHTVTAVAEEPPGNSSIPFTIVVPFDDIGRTIRGSRGVDNWRMSGFLTFVLVREGASAADLEEKLVPFRKKYYPEEFEANFLSTFGKARYQLQALEDMHLSRDVTGGIVVASNPTYSYILAGIAFVVLLIACINFMTLAIGRSASRAREIGVRKVVGALKTQLIGQFWGEALLLSAVALVLGLGLASAFLPVFNELSGKSLGIELASDAGTLLALVGMVLVSGLVAGSYPAFVLSGIKPVESLKSRIRIGGSTLLTRGLVVLQFGLSVFLTVSTFIMLSQLDYIRSQDLGFDKEQVVVIPTQGLDGDRTLAVFRNELGQAPDIVGVTATRVSFARGTSRSDFLYKGAQKYAYEYLVESDFLDVLGIELAAGRNFNPNLATDSTHAVIINEAMARDFGWSDPIGEVVSGLSGDDPANDPTVVGVVKDFHFQSLHSDIEPVMLGLGRPADIRFILARIAPGDVPATLERLRGTWERVTPDLPFTYSFLDEDLDRQYWADQRWSRIVGYGSFFAILVASLGLFGLASLTVAGRTKEIGIRKVLGASVAGVAGLMSKDFAWLVAVGVILAAPAAYYASSKWLEDFAYRIDVTPVPFLVGGALALFVAIATVSTQTVKAALSNPVESLRYE